MRRDTAKPTVSWAIQLEKSRHAAFTRLFPIRGNFTSIIVIGLEIFLARMELEPLLQVWAHEDIGRHLHLEERLESKQLVELNVPTPLYERFNRLLPEYGATSWFVRRLVDAVIASDAVPLPEQISEAVSRLIAGNPSPLSGVR